jgi:hypothetical protein
MDFSCAITEKSRVNEVAETDTEPEEPDPDPELLLELVEPLLEQAARDTPAVMASAEVQLILFNSFKQITSPVCRAAAGGRDLAPIARSLRPQLVTETIELRELTRP